MRGNPEALSTPALSIIGARKASPYGLAVAELAAKVAVEAGVTVVSGGAVGCDQGLEVGLQSTANTSWCWGRAPTCLPAFERGAYYAHALDTGGAVVSISPWGMGRASLPFRVAIA